MAEGCSHDCSNCSLECKDRVKIDFRENTNEFSNVKKVIGIISGKGGVGKSFVTSSLAVNSINRGKKVAILDADITGPSIPKMFGLSGNVKTENKFMLPKESKNGIKVISVNFLLKNETDPVIWRGPIIAGVVRQFWTDVIWDDVDYMYVDMPPGTGDVPLTVFQSLPLDGIVIVTTPQDLVGMVVEKAVKMANEMNIPILGLVENMSYFECPNCKEKHEIFGKSNIEKIAKKYNINIISKIPINSEYASLCDNGKIEDINTNYIDEIVNNIEKK